MCAGSLLTRRHLVLGLCGAVGAVIPSREQGAVPWALGHFDRHAKAKSALSPLRVWSQVSSMQWVEDEEELTALHQPGSRSGSGSEKAATLQRVALASALANKVDANALLT